MDESRVVSNSIIGQIRDSENPAAPGPPRGTAIVVLGTVLTGVTDGLARYVLTD